MITGSFRRLLRGLLVLMMTLAVASTVGCVSGTAETGSADLNKEKKETEMDSHAEIVQESVPSGGNPETAKEKGLPEDGNYTEEYYKMQNYYGEALYEYLDRKVSLKELDSAFDDMEISFRPREGDKQDAWQKHQSYGMKYFYIRNDLCVERLEAEDREMLQSFVDEKTAYTDERVISFVEKTLPLVIMYTTNADPNEEITLSLYSGRTLINKAVRLCMATVAEYDENGNFVSMENEALKSEFLRVYLPELQKELTEKLSYPVDVELISE